MRITNLLHFSENHRFYMFRDFSLSPVDYKMLSGIYQPMIGAFAISIYQLLYQQLPSERLGYSNIEQQRRLFLALELEPSERGRKMLAEYTSKLEAVGLLQTSRRYVSASDDFVYEYCLQAPLSPNEFFLNEHLSMLLRDKAGKYYVMTLRDELFAPEPKELMLTMAEPEDLTMPFYELFKLNAQAVDREIEQAYYEAAPAQPAERAAPSGLKGFDYADIIIRFPKESVNRRYVERLKHDHSNLAKVNYLASKYDLSLKDTCRLLDEDGAFNAMGDVNVDLLQQLANSQYRQGIKRDDDRERYLHKVDSLRRQTEDPSGAELQPEDKHVEPAFYVEVPAVLAGQCDIHQYNIILRNEPYTRVLKRFFPGNIPGYVLDIFEIIDLNYKLKEEVINLLIHYLKANQLSWNRKFIESIASDMLGKQIDSYEQAVTYIRESEKAKQKSAARAEGTRGRGRPPGKQKPKIPIATADTSAVPLTDEELEKMRRKAKRLDGMR